MADAINYILFALGIVFTIAVPLAIFGLRLNEGLWSNMICCSNITFASLITLNYFEPIAKLIEDAWAGGLFLYDFLVFWLLFSLMFFLLNTVTNKLSRVRVHFPKVVEQVGNGIFLILIFGNFVFNIGFTLPMAPFPPKENSQQTGEWQSNFLAYKMRILCKGTLVPFTGENIWDNNDPPLYVRDQVNKRWMLLDNMYAKGGTMLYDGSPPQHKRSEQLQ
ncbi:MAG: hypothetical protein FWC43_08470 [Planctomycetaceae bacterium]|nr:hypothetical protein [Planctomycetaceae bacterium]